MNPLKKNIFWVALFSFAAVAAFSFFLLSPPSADLPAPSAESADWDWRQAIDARDAPRPRAHPDEFTVSDDTPAPDITRFADVRSFLDPSASIGEREKAIFRFAREHPGEALKALSELLEDERTDSRLKAAAARALADIGEPEGRAIAERLTRDPDPVVARGAVKGLASQEDSETTDFLSTLLVDDETTETVRMEAALALAGMNSAHAVESLLRASYSDIDSDPGEPVLHAVLGALAANHYAQAGGYIDALLAHPEMDLDTKKATVESMAQAEGSEALNSLLKQARADDPELRDAAIWAIAGRDDVHLAGPDLLNLLESESTPWVRTSLYEALRYQDQLDVTPIWDRVIEEDTATARLAGMQVIARHMPDEAAARFDSEIVPELREIAANDSSRNNRLSAVIALGRAKTSAGAVDALLSLRENPDLDAQTKRAAEFALRP